MKPACHQAGRLDRTRSGRRCGFTLVELVTSMAIMLIVVVALASSLVIASHALPGRGNPVAVTNLGYEAVDQMATELYGATSAPERTARTVTFQVPDRNGDGSPETIRYAWSGQPGDPLTRQYNGGSVVDFLADVRSLTLGYTEKRVPRSGALSSNESAETQLAMYDSSNNLTGFGVSSTAWIGQYFCPVLPSNTLSWRVTQIAFRVKRSPYSGAVARVQVQTATAGQTPSGTVLESITVSSAGLPLSYGWKEASFANVSGLSRNQGLCLVVQYASGTVSCDVQYQSSGANPINSALITTATAGTSWAVRSDQSMRFMIYGTVTTPGPPQVVEVRLLSAVDLSLQAGDSTACRIDTTAQVLNQPEVTGP